ncbi:MAG: hypothetical protein E6Q32_10885 [Neisseriales bacterium]|jgi:conjugative transfer pilus assembly protein TraH|nr:MAG: hypothetical protein E6Q32_10885 [Neisseriales bacterium]
MKRLALLLMFCTSTYSFADVNQAVDNFFNSIQTDVNVPTVTQSQSAGVISGGGFSTRSQNINLQVAQFTPPSFSTGCGNLNFYSGSLSFMTNTDQLIKFLQNTLMTAAITAVMTALTAATPNIAGNIKSMMDQANKIMGMFNDSCQLGTALGNVSGTWMGDAYQKTTGSSLKTSGDAAGAFINNTVSGSGTGTIANNLSKLADQYHDWVSKNANTNPATDDATVRQFAQTYGSVMWKGMQSMQQFNIPGTSGGSNSVSDLANLVISLTGDVIIYSPDSNGTGKSVLSIPPAIHDVKDFMTESAPTLTLYNCTYFSTDKPGECNNENVTDFTKIDYSKNKVTWKGGVVKKVRAAMMDIQNHFVNNTSLTQDDLLIVAISPIPLFAVAQALDDIGMASSINNVLILYADQISFEVVQRLVNVSLTIATRATAGRSNADTAPAIQNLVSTISQLQDQVNSYSSQFVKTDPVEIMQKLNFLKAAAQNSMSPEIMQRVNFARQLGNY